MHIKYGKRSRAILCMSNMGSARGQYCACQIWEALTGNIVHIKYGKRSQAAPARGYTHIQTHTKLTPNSHQTHTKLTPNSHPTHTQLTPNSHQTHTQLTPNSHQTHTQLTPNSHPTHTKLIKMIFNSIFCITNDIRNRLPHHNTKYIRLS